MRLGGLRLIDPQYCERTIDPGMQPMCVVIMVTLVFMHIHTNMYTHVASCCHRGSTGPAEPLLRTTTTTNMAAANFLVKTCDN